MDFEQLDLDKLTDIKCLFSKCHLPSNEWLNVLIVKFAGTHVGGGAERKHVSFMHAMIRAGGAAWGCPGERMILDLRDLEYVWGDEMAGVLQDVPVVVVSDKCREGLESLVREEMQNPGPTVLLLDSIEEAVGAVDRRIAALKVAGICPKCGRPFWAP